MCVFFLHLRRLSGSFCGASVSREKLRRLTGWWRRSQLATATVTPGSSNPPVRTQRGFVSPESLSLAVQLKSVINFQRLEKKGNTRRVISLIRIKFFFSPVTSYLHESTRVLRRTECASLLCLCWQTRATSCRSPSSCSTRASTTPTWRTNPACSGLCPWTEESTTERICPSSCSRSEPPESR